MPAVAIRPDHKAIDAYYATLDELREGQDVHSEGNVRRAFSALLAETARERNWTLVEEFTRKASTGRAIRLDGVLRDQWQLPYGWWEAKDSADDLDSEIRKKREAGYPFKNIIFEDTREAVLFQDGQEVMRAKVRDRERFARLLTRFYTHEIQPFEAFGEAVSYFQAEIPQIATGLKERIETAHRENKGFQTAFGDFRELCRTALNPNISDAALDEMLIQHMLTERIIRKVFNVEEFSRRNVIAAEIEKVIDALTSRYFNRVEFLGALDRFYVAIERAAEELADDYADKQRFINTVYEKFFQGYSIKVADTHGIVYTPQEIVDFMCAAVEEVLEGEFGVKLGDEGVYVIDPCTGTGSFAVNLLLRAYERNPRHIERFYREGLFTNEVMLMPYYIASLNMEHTYYELTGKYEPFEGACFVDTLDLAEGAQMRFSFMTEKNTERVERQKQAPITVIIGNPPYNVGQVNENDNNKNRTYKVIDDRVRETYAKDSKATLKAQLYDPYVKFFRWAADRLQGRDGIVCFVSNNGFYEGIAFDGFRKHLGQDFTAIYHLDLSGNARTSGERRRREGGNVFDDKIRVGVGITVAVRKRDSEPSPLTPLPQGEGNKPSPLAPPRPRQGEGNEVQDAVFRARAAEAMTRIARDLRQRQTPAEELLWEVLRNRRLDGLKFRRQHPVENTAYVADFLCYEARLVIELDGGIHDTQVEEDTVRQQNIEEQGYRVLRFRNEQVINETEQVLTTIIATAHAAASPRPEGTPEEYSPRPDAEAEEQEVRAYSPRPEGEGLGVRVPHFFYHRVPDYWRKEEKLEYLVRNVELLGRWNALNTIAWDELTPDERHTWLVPEHAGEFETLIPIKNQTNTGIFELSSNGVKTNRDSWVYDFDSRNLEKRSRKLVEDYNSEVDRYKRSKNLVKDIDDFVRYDLFKWDGSLKQRLQSLRYGSFDTSLIRKSLYRPFAIQNLYFDWLFINRVYQQKHIFPDLASEGDNRLICVSGVGSNKPFHALITDRIPCLDLLEKTQCFPFYVYDEDGTNRRENITDWALAQFRARYTPSPLAGRAGEGSETKVITKWDIFYYVYALLHHPDYRERYADNLKRDLPRIPLVSPRPEGEGLGVRVFWQFAESGRKLADLHLNYESVEPYELKWATTGQISYKVEKMRPQGTYNSPRPEGEGAGVRVYTTLKVNDTLTLEGIPPQVFAYRLGNRSALDWVIDQYRVKTDKRSGITSDPNGYSDDERYIVDLVEKVVRVSLETVAIVDELASLPFRVQSPPPLAG